MLQVQATCILNSQYSVCVHVLSRFGDHYEWNKVTSCIHNILSGQRWIEHYGEMAIKNINSDACQCKVTFVKVRKCRYLMTVFVVDVCNPTIDFREGISYISVGLL